MLSNIPYPVVKDNFNCDRKLNFVGQVKEMFELFKKIY